MSEPSFNFMSIVLQSLATAGAFARCALQERMGDAQRGTGGGRIASGQENGFCVSMCAELKLWGVDADESLGLPEVAAERIAWGLHLVATPDGRAWRAWHRLPLDPLRPAAEQVGLPDDLNWELVSTDGSLAAWEASIFVEVGDTVEQLRTGDERADARLPYFGLAPVGGRVVRPGIIKCGPGGHQHLSAFMPYAGEAAVA